MRIGLLNALFSLTSRTLPRWEFRLLVRAATAIPTARFRRAARNPLEAQTRRLLGILRRNRDTVFGREHGFAEIGDIDGFRRRVPVGNYETFEPFIRRMMAGERDVLVSGRAACFATTSGTVHTRKFIPVTPAYLKEYKACLGGMVRSLTLAFPETSQGFPLAIVSKKIEGHTEAGIPFGSISQELSGRGIFSAGNFSAVPPECFLIEDFEARYYVILLLALQQRITTWVAINPSTLMLLCEKLNLYAVRLAADLDRGTLDSRVPVPPELRRRIERGLKPNAARARRLRAPHQSGFVRPIDVWPELAGLACWKGGSSSFYLDQFPRFFGNTPVLDLGYLATEGAFSIPLDPLSSDGVYAVLSHFCEFIPAAEREADPGNPFPRTLLCHELRAGERYYVIVTGSHGLCRYDMNDVIQVTGFFEATPRITFLHRGGNVLSHTGEKITEWHAVSAIKAGAVEAGVRLEGFSLTVRLRELPRYVFAVELAEDFDPLRCARLLAVCERGLQRFNCEYAEKRASGRLGEPLLHVLAPRSYLDFRKRRVSGGAPDAQVKPPILFPSEEALLAEFAIVRTVDGEEASRLEVALLENQPPDPQPGRIEAQEQGVIFHEPVPGNVRLEDL